MGVYGEEALFHLLVDDSFAFGATGFISGINGNYHYGKILYGGYMKYEVTNDQFKYFRRHGELSLDGCFSYELTQVISGLLEKKDIWRRNNLVRKEISSRCICDIIFELTLQKPIRILYDQMVDDSLEIEKLPFQDILIILSINETATFQKASTPLIKGPIYTIVYGKINSTFVDRKSIHINEMKNMGYSNGDKLKVKDFPIIYK